MKKSELFCPPFRPISHYRHRLFKKCTSPNAILQHTNLISVVASQGIFTNLYRNWIPDKKNVVFFLGKSPRRNFFLSAKQCRKRALPAVSACPANVKLWQPDMPIRPVFVVIQTSRVGSTQTKLRAKVVSAKEVSEAKGDPVEKNFVQNKNYIQRICLVKRGPSCLQKDAIFGLPASILLVSVFSVLKIEEKPSKWRAFWGVLVPRKKSSVTAVQWRPKPG